MFSRIRTSSMVAHTSWCTYVRTHDRTNRIALVFGVTGTGLSRYALGLGTPWNIKGRNCGGRPFQKGGVPFFVFFFFFLPPFQRNFSACTIYGWT